MIEVFKAKNGSDSVRISELQLLSAYSPENEVKKFLETLKLKNKQLVLLCGETLGYLEKFISREYPQIRIVVIYYDCFFSEYCRSETAAHWNPKSQTKLPAFLQKNISLMDTIGMEIISWKASDHAFTEVSDKIHETINQFLLESSGTLGTIKQFGNLWFRNGIKNFLSLENLSQFPRDLETPLVITASGPTLKSNYDFIKNSRENLTVWALPSSVEALLTADIVPDMIVQTDPGFYATHHLRSLSERAIPIAMPLTACRSIWNYDGPVLLFSQDSLIEKSLLKEFSDKIPSIPPAGTVAISALFLAFRLTSSSPLFLAGYDFLHQDILTHTLPNAFMSLFRSEASRVSPLLGTMVERSGTDGKEQAPPLKTYSGWIKRFSGKIQSRVFRLTPTRISLGEIPDLSTNEASDMINSYSKGKIEYKSLLPGKDLSERKNTTALVLSAWLKEIDSFIIERPFRTEDFFQNNPLEEMMLHLAPYPLLRLKKEWPSLEQGEKDTETTNLLATMKEILHNFREEIAL